MRILIAAHSGRTSGIDTYTGHLAHGLRERGHEVLTAYRSASPARPAAAAEAVHLGAPNRRLRRLIGPLESATVHGRLRRLARSRGCAVVHATYPEFAFAGRPPVVVSAWHPESRWPRRAATARTRQEGFRAEALYAISDTIAYRRASVIALSQAVQRDVAHRGRRAEWIPPFLPDELVRPPRPARPPTCTFIARWLDAPRKGLGLAVAATGLLAAELPGLRLQLVGGWRDPAAAGRLPAHCTHLGLRSPGEVRELLAASGCCLIASVWEEFGYTGIEALAAGAPLACPPLPGYEGLASDGIVVAGRRDAGSLAEAIHRALAVRRFEFPADCRSSVAIPQVEKVYAELADGS